MNAWEAPQLDDLVTEFVLEASEGLDRFDAELLRLRTEPSAETVASMRRTWHTIKGTSGCLGLDRIESLASAAEDQLARLDEGDAPVALSELAGETRRQLAAIETARPSTDTRTQPLDSAFRAVPHLVQHLSRRLGKSVRLRTEGELPQLDTRILAPVRESLIHLVRNAVDHGIEVPQRRTEVGKPSEGTLSMRADELGGWLVLEVTDDGAGIDPSRLRREAVARGLLPPEEACRMDDEEALWLVFAPSLSTASRVTSISGRGVGLDVVRANVDRLGGCIDVHSTRGEGTTFRIQIPFAGNGAEAA